MAKRKKKTTTKKQVETLTHNKAKRTNIPTAEFESVMRKTDRQPVSVATPRPGKKAAEAIQDETDTRNVDLDPQLVWRGKDTNEWSDLVVQAPPLFIQEKVHPKALIDDLRRQTEAAEIAKKMAGGDAGTVEDQMDLFADFNGLPDDPQVRTEFYQHDAHWTNRMILGDSLAVMASLAEREGLRGKVQCIYLDPPYGIKFNSNFQWSTTSRDVKDGKADHITREPEQVKAFRDTWRDGIHSYLTYLRDRLTVARDLLHESGSIFVQIGDENLHRVRMVLDEVFGSDNLVSQINFKSMGALGQGDIPNVYDYIVWFAKSKSAMKFRPLHRFQDFANDPEYKFVADASDPAGYRVLDKDEPQPEGNEGLFRRSTLTSSGYTPSCTFDFDFHGTTFKPFGRKSWRTNAEGMKRLTGAGRLFSLGKNLYFQRHANDACLIQFENSWTDAPAASERIFIVQTAPKFVERCLLMVTDPGDLILDPTCGSGTTAYVAEQWGRRWITVDTSRVSLALARARIMGARYPYYLLADSPEGKQKEAELTHTEPSSAPTSGGIRQGFVYERVPHIMLKNIANNAEIDVIWEKFQQRLEPLREKLNKTLGEKWEEWEIPREAEEDWSKDAKDAHARWWEQRIQRQKEIDASIAAKADSEYLYDKPYDDKKKVRVAGPFTVESLSPHRVLGVDENDELIDPLKQSKKASAETVTAGEIDPFLKMVLENLRTAGVQQAHKEDKITFTSIKPHPGEYIGAEGRYVEGDPDKSNGSEKRAGIFIGPEFGTVSRQDLVVAAREAADMGFDVLIACAFNYEAHASEFSKLGGLPILKARMNADLHMADDLKNTGKGNLFVIFGEPDIDLLPPENAPEDAPQPKNGEPADLSEYETMRVRINGVDVFHPSTGKVESDGAEGIACWFIDTDYNEESFFVRQAYFLGANDPYKSLKTTLKAEIDKDAWETLHSDTSREFAKPKGGRIAVKVINHLGDEVMKVFRVE